MSTHFKRSNSGVAKHDWDTLLNGEVHLLSAEDETPEGFISTQGAQPDSFVNLARTTVARKVEAGELPEGSTIKRRTNPENEAQISFEFVVKAVESDEDEDDTADDE